MSSVNDRVFYAIRRAGIAKDGDDAAQRYLSIRGLQTLGITTNFELINVFELGQAAIYENIEGIPEVTIQMDKVMDGQAPVYCMATSGAASADVIARAKEPCQVAMSIHEDTELSCQEGEALTTVEMSGMYVTSVSYTANVNDNITESVGFAGSHKSWSNTADVFKDEPFQDNDDTALSGVSRRENVLFGDGESKLPTNIPGINGSGYNILAAGKYPAHVQSISISTDLGREDLFELGHKREYAKTATYPIEVTTEIGILSVSGDMIDADPDADNLTDQAIILKTTDGLWVDVGSKNKLQSVVEADGDTTGGNVTLTYTYLGYNDFTVYHSSDPAGFAPS